MLDPRSAYILKGVVTEYIRGARPVGSAWLTRRLRLDMSPATMRTLLHELEEAGYLTQPHISAGRVPTDQGYRYYVDHGSETAASSPTPQQLATAYRQLQAEHQLARATTKLLARLSQAIAVSGFLARGEVQETGLNEVLQQPEGESVPTVKELSAVLEKMEEFLDQLSTSGPGTQTYIGSENPLLPAMHTSMIIKSISTPQGRVVLAVVGPKRMSYHRNVRVLEMLGGLLQRLS